MPHNFSYFYARRAYCVSRYTKSVVVINAMEKYVKTLGTCREHVYCTLVVLSDLIVPTVATGREKIVLACHVTMKTTPATEGRDIKGSGQVC